jgi:hypothetical protein
MEIVRIQQLQGHCWLRKGFHSQLWYISGPESVDPQHLSEVVSD